MFLSDTTVVQTLFLVEVTAGILLNIVFSVSRYTLCNFFFIFFMAAPAACGSSLARG